MMQENFETSLDFLLKAEGGSIGPVTLQNIDITDKHDLITRFSEAKKHFYESLPTFPTFGEGWLNRINEARGNASSMLG